MKRKVFNKMLNKILMFIIIFSSFIFSLNITNLYAKTYENSDTIVEEKTYYNGTIEDNFSDDKIIIVLSKEETNKYKDYTISDFPEIDCQSVIDLTSNYNELLKNSNNNYNDQTLINYEKFNRILCLELNQKSKENVLLGIKELEKREEILSAEPSFFIEMMVTPNDEENVISFKKDVALITVRNVVYNDEESFNVVTNNFEQIKTICLYLFYNQYFLNDILKVETFGEDEEYIIDIYSYYVVGGDWDMKDEYNIVKSTIHVSKISGQILFDEEKIIKTYFK